MEQLGGWIADVLANIGSAEIEQRIRRQVAELAGQFPIYEARMKGGKIHAEHARV